MKRTPPHRSVSTRPIPPVGTFGTVRDASGTPIHFRVEDGRLGRVVRFRPDPSGTWWSYYLHHLDGRWGDPRGLEVGPGGRVIDPVALAAIRADLDEAARA